MGYQPQTQRLAGIQINNTATIAALATASGRGAVGVIRVSGPFALPMLQSLSGRQDFTPRQTKLITLFADGQALDQVLAIWFAAPASYTGEDVVELQTHGNPALLTTILHACLAALAEQGRLAEPGEFTRRAFVNGKLDLAQAEAVADLIAAESDRAAQLALRTLRGEFSRQVHIHAEQFQTLRALVESTLDFSDEPVDWLGSVQVSKSLEELLLTLGKLVEQAQAGMPYRNGLTVAIVGRPNVGKSSLLNALCGDEIAIVSPIAGTTRDLIREHLHINGVPITLIDTAGLRPSQDSIEQEGVKRARNCAAQADVVIFVADSFAGWTVQDAEQWELTRVEGRLILVWNKQDLLSKSQQQAILALRPLADSSADILTSASARLGLEALRNQILDRVVQHEESVFLVQQRHIEALLQAQSHLRNAQTWVATSWERHPELVAEELRLAHAQLMTITGRWDVENLLGDIFSRFCIGK